MSLLSESNDDNQNQNLSIQEFYDGEQDSVDHHCNRNAFQEIHQHQLCSGVGTFTYVCYMVFIFMLFFISMQSMVNFYLIQARFAV